MKNLITKTKICFAKGCSKIHLILFAIFCFSSFATSAQDMPSELAKLLSKEFKSDEMDNISWSKEDDGSYYVENIVIPYRYEFYVSNDFKLLYKDISTDAPGFFDDFRKKFISKNAEILIQKKYAKIKKNISKDHWFANYYKSGINGKEILAIREFIVSESKFATDDDQTPPTYYFDINGNFLFEGDEIDMGEKMGIVVEKRFPYKINTSYYIKNKETGKYLDVYGNNKDNYGKIVEWDHTNSLNQQFQIMSIDQNKHVKIQNNNSLKMLSGLPDGKNIIQFESDAGEKQVFEIDFGPNKKSKYVIIKLTYSGKCLSVGLYDNTYDFTPIIEREFEETNPDSQLWELIEVEE